MSFQSLAESVTEVRAIEKTEAAWTAMRAAQGNVKGMKEWIADRWPQLEEGKKVAQKSDLTSLMAALKPDKLV